MSAFLQEVTFDIEATKEIRAGRLNSVENVNESLETEDLRDYIL